MVCKICGTELEEGAVFCHQCGERVTQQNVCPKCGKDLPDEAAFCMHCGMNLKAKEKFENEKKQFDGFLKKEEEKIEKQNRTRSICYAPQLPIQAMIGAMVYGRKLHNSKEDGSYITKNQVIATLKIDTYKQEIRASRDGIVFYLKNDGESVIDRVAVAIIGDLSDTREDVMTWYKNQK